MRNREHTARRRLPAAAGVLAAGLVAALSGACAGPSAVERRVPGPVPAREAPGWELVLASGETGEECWRRDGALNVHAGESSYPLDLYPSPAPTLDRWRWLTLPRNPENVLVLRQGSRWFDHR